MTAQATRRGASATADPGAPPSGDISSGDIQARVRLAVGLDTPPALLLRLAQDGAVTVRAAVAMNAAAAGAIDAELAGDPDERVRALLAGKLAKRLPGADQGADQGADEASDRREQGTAPGEQTSGGQTPGQQAQGQQALEQQALATLNRLVDDAAIRVRMAVAEAVKARPNAPRDLVLRLAGDCAGTVCGPVIRLSPLLTVADLLALLEAMPSPDTAIAVAGRPKLAATVCDAIAAGRDNAAIATLLGNPTAAIREATLDRLVERAAGEPLWQAPLVRRPHLTPRAARMLSQFVAAHLLEELVQRHDVEPGFAAELRRRLETAQPSRPPADGKPGVNTVGMPIADLAPRTSTEPSTEEAMGQARHLLAEDRLDEAALLAALHNGELRRSTALLAVAAGVPASVVDRAASLRSAKGLVSLLWQAGFSMRPAASLQGLLARIGPASVLRPGPDGGFPLAVEEMRWQLDFLGKMGR